MVNYLCVVKISRTFMKTRSRKIALYEPVTVTQLKNFKTKSHASWCIFPCSYIRILKWRILDNFQNCDCHKKIHFSSSERVCFYMISIIMCDKYSIFFFEICRLEPDYGIFIEILCGAIITIMFVRSNLFYWSFLYIYSWRKCTFHKLRDHTFVAFQLLFHPKTNYNPHAWWYRIYSILSKSHIITLLSLSKIL